MDKSTRPLEDTNTLRLLMEAVKKVIGDSKIDEDIPIVDLGIDSLALVDALFDTKDIYPDVHDLDMLEIGVETTLRDLDRQLLSQSARPANAS